MCSFRQLALLLPLLCLIYTVLNHVLWTVLHTDVPNFLRALNVRSTRLDGIVVVPPQFAFQFEMAAVESFATMERATPRSAYVLVLDVFQ